MYTLDGELLATLRAVDTPTVCNAIEVAQGRRGFDRFTRGTPIHTAPDEPALVGFARTARIRGSTPSEDDVDVTRARRMAYFESMAEGPRPTVAVIEDEDWPSCEGAWWGEVHVAVHKGLGMAGALTNGLVRDIGDLDHDFPVVAGGVGPSHRFVHVRSIGERVRVFGLEIEQGDLVHADRHGAVVIPTRVLPKLVDAIATLHESEALVLGPAREEGFSIERLRVAWAAFERART